PGALPMRHELRAVQVQQLDVKASRFGERLPFTGLVIFPEMSPNIVAQPSEIEKTTSASPDGTYCPALRFLNSAISTRRGEV
ncbi:MAG TPA: hypothetical protein VFB21_14870, partial [Chthonomonadaceae bacterium]|nr:hypothetical protein [Chthonomonadaceae bacterium]